MRRRHARVWYVNFLIGRFELKLANQIARHVCYGSRRRRAPSFFLSSILHGRYLRPIEGLHSSVGSAHKNIMTSSVKPRLPLLHSTHGSVDRYGSSVKSVIRFYLFSKDPTPIHRALLLEYSKSTFVESMIYGWSTDEVRAFVILRRQRPVSSILKHFAGFFEVKRIHRLVDSVDTWETIQLVFPCPDVVEFGSRPKPRIEQFDFKSPTRKVN